MARQRHEAPNPKQVRTIGSSSRLRSCTVLLAVALGAYLLPATASAELCSPTSQICIVNPPTAASPWVAPQLVQLRLPSDADPFYSHAAWTQPGTFEGEFPRALGQNTYPELGPSLKLIEAGPPGGTSLYQAIVEPEVRVDPPRNIFAPADGTLNLMVEAKHNDEACGCLKETSATFAGLPILGTVGGFKWRIVRRRTRYAAVMSFYARSPLRLEQLFHISGFNGQEVDLGHLFVTRRKLGVGPQKIVQKLSTKYVERHCAPYRRCVLFAEAELGAPFINNNAPWSQQRVVKGRGAGGSASGLMR